MDPRKDYSSAELAENLGVTVMTISRRARKEAWPHVKRPGRGGGRLYPFASLPPDVRAAITAHEARQLPAPVSPHHEAKPIPERAHEIGLARYQLYGAWRQYTRKHKGNKNAATDAFLAAYNAGQSHPSIFNVLGTTSRSALYAWARKLREAAGDYRVLCDHRGWAQAEGKEGNLGPEAERIFLKIYLNPQRPSKALSYRAMCAALAERGLAEPSMRTTYRFIKRYERENRDHVVLMREGEKALADLVGPFISRDGNGLQVGDVLFADGHRLNFDSIHPLTGRPARMTLIVWFDWASRMPVGWEVMPEEDTIAISSALFMAIKNLGKYPKVVYIDNGRAFRAEYFSKAASDEMPMRFSGLYARLGISVQYSRPYQARTKLVERFFGTFDAQCARLLPSHRGSSVADKPAYLARNEKFHQRRHDRFVPTVEQTMDVFKEYVGWYALQPHEGLKGAKPVEVFAEGRGPGIPLRELTRHFLWRKQVKPRRCRVRLAGIDFESDALYGLDQTVAAMFSWADLSEVHLYTLRGDYLGTAKPVEALHPVARHLGDEIDLVKVKEANKRQARLKAQTMRMARETEASADVISILPWMGRQERVPLPAPQPKDQERAEAPQLSREEIAAIEAAQAAYEESQKNAPPYERPRFDRPLDRYEHLFNVREFENKKLVPEDAAFMRQYEESPEYRIAKRRFDQLMELKAALTEQAEEVR